jgi:hypothetical protein
MEAEHLYHWLGRFFKESPKITWEKNEIQNALKEQYIELLNSDFTVESPIPRSSARTPPHQEPAPKLIHRTLDLARLNVKAVSLGRLVALLEKTSSISQTWLSRASRRPSERVFRKPKKSSNDFQ